MSSFSSLRALLSGGPLQKLTRSPIVQQLRHQKKWPTKPKIQNPIWFARKERATFDQELTKENQAFVKEMVYAKHGPPAIIHGVETFAQPSFLKDEPIEYGKWSPGVRRTGLIARKIGVYPMWMKNGKKISTTLLQVVDNHVINYIPPELYESPRKAPRRYKNLGKWGCLVVGAERKDPQEFTKEYCGIFKDSGVPPTKLLTRFLISPEARLQPGTPLSALHYQVGDYIDVFGLTKFRGFQGVMKRWGFHGMPRSHGVTKTHRRGGNIGAGGNKARVWPGTKMPGFMGNRRRTLKGAKIVRINTKYNVIYVVGQSIPGGTNGVVYLHDTMLPLKWHKDKGPANFPTFMPSQLDESGLPEDIFDDSIHQFADPSITYVDDEVKDPKKK